VLWQLLLQLLHCQASQLTAVMIEMDLQVSSAKIQARNNGTNFHKHKPCLPA